MKKIVFAAIALCLFPICSWAMGQRPPAEEVRPAAADDVRALTLEDCYEIALRRSEQVAMLREAVSKTSADKLKATAEAIGDGDFVITNFQQDEQLQGGGGGSSVGSTLTSTERRERRFVINQPLFQGFKTLGALAGAGSLTRQRQQEHERGKEILFLDVANAFYHLLEQKRDMVIIQEIHQLYTERLHELSEREKIGRSRIGEIATATAQMKVLESEFAASEGAYAQAENQMEFYLGLSADEVKYVDTPIAEKPPADLKGEKYEEILESRPDVQGAYQAMKTAKQAILVAQSGLWPQIDLDATNYEKRQGFQGDINWDVLFTIRVPLWRGGLNLGNIKEAVSNYEIAKLNYMLVKKQAALEIKTAYQSWLTASRKHIALEEAVKAAKKNYGYEKEDYTKSLVNNLDVLSALQVYLDTSRDANIAFYEMKNAYWQFQIATGKGIEAYRGSSDDEGYEGDLE